MKKKIHIFNGDCQKVLKNLGDNTIDAVVTDPPYELGFMGKSWDKTGIAYNVELWKEVYRVLKPGAHLLSFGGSRTYHRMACAIEDAGFEIRDQIMWVYGSGFPKSLNIGKVMDKFLKTGNASWNGTGDSTNGALGYSKLQHQQGYRPDDYSNKHQNKTKITEEKAKVWEGYATALKPAHEPIVLARKPLSEKTVAENCLKWGVGGLAIDGCRVGYGDEKIDFTRVQDGNIYGGNDIYGKAEQKEVTQLFKPNGRFPANFIHDGSDEVVELFPNTKSGALNSGHKRGDGTGNSFMGGGGIVKGNYGNDSGSAARFFMKCSLDNECSLCYNPLRKVTNAKIQMSMVRKRV